MDNSLYEEAYDMAIERADREGDVDVIHDYMLIEKWIDEYYEMLVSNQTNTELK